MLHYNKKNSYLLKYFENQENELNVKLYDDSKTINLLYVGSKNQQNIEYVHELINFIKSRKFHLNLKLYLCGEICCIIDTSSSQIIKMGVYQNLENINIKNIVGININNFQTGISTKNLEFIKNKFIIFSKNTSQIDFSGNYPIYYFSNYDQLEKLINDFENIKTNYLNQNTFTFNYSDHYKLITDLLNQ